MPTASLGLTLTYPAAGDRNWQSVIKTLYEAVSAHDHTGSGKGLAITSAAFGANVIKGTSFRLDNAEWVRARNAANSADVNLVRLNSSDVLEFGNVGAATRTNLGLGSLATLSAINGSNWSGTDLAVADGGTGASTLTGYVKGAGTSALTGQATIPSTDITGLGSLATLSTINNANWSGTDLSVANGGTGASTAGAALVALGAAASGWNMDITRLLGSATITTWTPTVVKVEGSGTLNSYTILASRYIEIGKFRLFSVSFTLNITGTLGVIGFDLPDMGISGSYNIAGGAGVYASGGNAEKSCQWWLPSGFPGRATIAQYDRSATAFVNGGFVAINGFYEAA